MCALESDAPGRTTFVFILLYGEISIAAFIS